MVHYVSAVYILCIMALMIMSICSTVYVLTLHHSHYPVPSGIKSLTFGFLAKMLCINTTGNISGIVGPALPTMDQSFLASTITGKEQEKQHKPLGGWSDHQFVANHLEMLVWYKAKQAEEEAQHADWMRVAAIMDRLFLLLFTMATVIISVVLLGIYPLTRPCNIHPRNVS